MRRQPSLALLLRKLCGHVCAPLLSCTALACVFLLSGCHGAVPLTAQEQAGKHLYTVRCAHCHEYNDQGLKKVPPDLHNVFRGAQLPSGAPATDEQVRREVLSGRGMMPPFAGRFSDEEMAALLAYLHTGLR